MFKGYAFDGTNTEKLAMKKAGSRKDYIQTYRYNGIIN